MSTTTTTPLTANQQTLLDARDAKVAEWTTTNAKLTAAVEARRSASPKSAAAKAAQKTAWSEGGKLANRKHEIRQLEIDLRLEDVPFTPWEEPAKTTTSSTRLLPMSKTEIETKLAKLRALAATGVPETVKHDIDVRVRALVKAAEVRGYEVA